jgi:translation elongation factor EF-1beta
MMHQNYRALKELIAGYFVDQYKSSYELICDHDSPLFDIQGLKSMSIRSELALIRPTAVTMLRELGVSDRIDDSELQVLEEQISEIVKNAVIHGNRKEPEKTVSIWFGLDEKSFRLIVEDQGSGFANLEEWNEFNRKRNEALKKGDMEEIINYVQYRTPDSTEHDGGNALFAAVEFWDSSLVYNYRRNKVAALKYLSR